MNHSFHHLKRRGENRCKKGRKHFLCYKVFESGALKEALPKFESANINSRGTTELGDTFYRYVKFDFYFPQEEEGSIFVLKKQSSFVDLTQKLFPILFVSLLLLAILLIGLLSYLVSRSVIKPIFVLKDATEKLKKEI